MAAALLASGRRGLCRSSCRLGRFRAFHRAGLVQRVAHEGSEGGTGLAGNGQGGAPGDGGVPRRSSWLVAHLNATLEDYPTTSFLTFIGASYGVFGLSYVGLSAAGFSHPDLAVAVAIARALRWFKRPVDFALAVLLARAWPAATAIRLGPLIIPPAAQVAQAKPGAAEEGGPAAAADLTTRWVSFATSWLEGPVNKYGAPFLLSRWVTGLTVVSGLTAMVHTGVDVGALVGNLVSNPSVADTMTAQASAVAGAMVINTAVLPLRVLLFALLARAAFERAGLRPVHRPPHAGRES